MESIKLFSYPGSQAGLLSCIAGYSFLLAASGAAGSPALPVITHHSSVTSQQLSVIRDRSPGVSDQSKTNPIADPKSAIQIPPDVPSGHWAYVAVKELAKRKILKPQGKLEGDQPITRYELALALYRLVKYLEKGTASAPKGPENRTQGTAPGAHQRSQGLAVGARALQAKQSPLALKESEPRDPAAWLVSHGYLTADTPLAQAPFTGLVSPGLLADSLAYTANRILLSRASPGEQTEEIRPDPLGEIEGE